MYSKINKDDKKILLILIIAAFISNLMFININYAPMVQADEYGYLGIAAYFAKIDWTDLLNCVYYYSFGYPLLLAPLFIIFKEPLLVYKGAMILNSLFIAFSIPVIYSFIKNIYPNIQKKAWITIIIMLSFNSITVSRTANALTEPLLIFLFWHMIYLFKTLTDKVTTKNLVIFSILSGYAYMVHQRTVVFVIATFIVFLLMFFGKKLKLVDFLKYALIVFAFIFITSTVKEKFLINIWTSDSLRATNDYNSVIDLLLTLFTYDGFILFCKNFIGYFFYFGQSTFLIGYLGLYFIIRDLIKCIINKFRIKDNSGELYYLLFFFLCFIGTVALTSLFFINYKRLDTIMYGRYSEMVVLPIACYGISKAIKLEKFSFKIIILNSLILLTIAFLLLKWLPNIQNMPYSAFNVPSIDFFIKQNLNVFSVYKASFVSIVIFLLIIAIVKKTNLYIIAAIFFCLPSVWFVYSYIKKPMLYDKYFVNINADKFTEIRKSENINDVYVLLGGYELKPYPAIQFYLFDKPMNVIMQQTLDFTKKDITYRVKSKDYLITDYISEKILDNFIFEKFGASFLFLKPNIDNSKSEFKINGANLASKLIYINDTSAQSLGKTEIDTFIAAPEFILEKGKYTVKFDMELVSFNGNENDKFSSIYVNDVITNTLIAGKDLYSKDITTNKFTYTLEVDAKNRFSSVNFTVNGYNDNIVKVNSVTIESGND